VLLFREKHPGWFFSCGPELALDALLKLFIPCRHLTIFRTL
jgi:hypothetical protein